MPYQCLFCAPVERVEYACRTHFIQQVKPTLSGIKYEIDSNSNMIQCAPLTQSTYIHWSLLANANDRPGNALLLFVACLLIQNPYYPVSFSVTIWYFVCCGCKHLNRDHLSECHRRAKAKWKESDREGEKI